MQSVLNDRLKSGLLVMLLAGCATTAPTVQQPVPEERKPPPVNLSGYTPAFKMGYSDGCSSAGARNPRRDESRYKTEADYMMGWNDGYSVCRKGK